MADGDVEGGLAGKAGHPRDVDEHCRLRDGTVDQLRFIIHGGFGRLAIPHSIPVLFHHYPLGDRSMAPRVS